MPPSSTKVESKEMLPSIAPAEADLHMTDHLQPRLMLRSRRHPAPVAQPETGLTMITLHANMGQQEYLHGCFSRGSIPSSGSGRRSKHCHVSRALASATTLRLIFDPEGVPGFLMLGRDSLAS